MLQAHPFCRAVKREEGVAGDVILKSDDNAEHGHIKKIKIITSTGSMMR